MINEEFLSSEAKKSNEISPPAFYKNYENRRVQKTGESNEILFMNKVIQKLNIPVNLKKYKNIKNS